MAVASKTWTAAYGPYVRLRITAQELEVDVANNRSKVRVTGQIYYPGGTTARNAYPQTYTVTVNGTQIGKQTGITYVLSAGATKSLTTYTSGWITHGSNGAKTVTVKGHITDSAGDTGSISQSYALTTIARASTLSSFSMPNALLWNSRNTIHLGITRRSSSFTHDIQLRDGSTVIASWTGQGTPRTLILSAAQVDTLLNRTNGAATRTMTLRVQTKSGSTNIGSALTRTATASIHSSARASVLNSFSMPNHMKPGTTTTFNLGLTRRSSSFTHDIQLRDGSTVIASWTGQGTPTTRSLTAAQTNTLLSRMSSSTSRTMTLRVQTKSGSTNIGGALTRTATVYVHSDVTPNVSALSVTIEGNAHAKNNVKRFVQSISRVSGKFTRTATGGATISSSKLEIRRKSGGADLQSINSNSGTFPRVVSLSGPYQARGTATDSRGRSSNTGWLDLSNFDVLAYSVPQITRFTTTRLASPATTVNIVRNGTHSGLSRNNILTITLQKRASGTTSWTNVVPNVTTTSNSFNEPVPSTGNSVASSYDFRLYIVDQFGNSAEQISTVSTQRVVLDVHKNEGVGVGKVHEQGVLDVDGSVYLTGRLMLQPAGASLTSKFQMYSNDLNGHGYIEYFGSDNNRKVYIGIPNSDNDNLVIQNENNADVSIRGRGIYANGSEIWTNEIVDSGTNSNGTWVRFPDGTQICWSHGNVTPSASDSTTIGGGQTWYRNSQWVNFPKSFASASTIEAVVSSNSSVPWGVAVGTTDVSTTSCQVWVTRYNTGNTTYRMITVGRWK